MPLPFLIAGAIATAIYGAKKGYDAYDDYDTAEYWNDKARKLYNGTKSELENQRKKAKTEIEALGKLKFEIYDYSIYPFLKNFKKIKNIEGGVIVNGEKKLFLSVEEMSKLKNMSIELEELVGGGIVALGAGGLAGLAAYGAVGALATASTGTAIGGLSGVAATNATLAWLGGGALSAGGFGMAGGMAVLGGIVAGPVLAVGGLMLASKAEEAKHNAYSNYDKTKLATEEMKTAIVATKGITSKVTELINLLTKLNVYFRSTELFLERLTQKSTNFRTYKQSEKERLFLSFGLFETLSNLLSVNLFTKEGSITKELNNKLNNSSKLIETFQNDSKSIN